MSTTPEKQPNNNQKSFSGSTMSVLLQDMARVDRNLEQMDEKVGKVDDKVDELRSLVLEFKSDVLEAIHNSKENLRGEINNKDSAIRSEIHYKVAGLIQDDIETNKRIDQTNVEINKVDSKQTRIFGIATGLGIAGYLFAWCMQVGVVNWFHK